jgi:hypothetical protein
MRAPNRVTQKFNGFFTENLSYKLVSLFIALILWFTILGRRDFVMAKNIDVEILVPFGYVLESQNVDRLRVKATGPRMALKKFMDSGFAQQVTIDASSKGEGEFELEVPLGKIDVPFGVRVTQVKPNLVKVVIKKVQ